ncbi:polymer-forming cytoskeletal protein [uncultured Phenylobacterium sp.]|uniref:bactofilin family protein n=1 Tax=uncultured Phenylobacterium sp. TaxID=349273 RepID=UPI0025D68AD9|nr:polymer-forming cytoskeletal protein [uncultured Phenylobacterium sp.]
MFSKAAKGGEPADLTLSAPRKVAVASLVAEGVRIQGDLATEGDLHLDGAVEGDLRVGQLTIGETGRVSGSIQADTVEIRGCVTGTITARHVRLWPTARVDGDISHAELAIEAGAHFVGRSLALAAEPALLSAVAAE